MIDPRVVAASRHACSKGFVCLPEGLYRVCQPIFPFLSRSSADSRDLDLRRARGVPGHKPATRDRPAPDPHLPAPQVPPPAPPLRVPTPPSRQSALRPLQRPPRPSRPPRLRRPNSLLTHDPTGTLVPTRPHRTYPTSALGKPTGHHQLVHGVTFHTRSTVAPLRTYSGPIFCGKK